MNVSTEITTYNGENVIKIIIDTGGYVVCKNQYFKVFNANGVSVYRFPADGYYGAGSETRTFILESVPDIINLYPNSKSVSFTVEHHQENTLIGWRRVDTKTITCTLLDNSYTRPTVDMSTALAPLVNGYNMKGTTKVKASFSGAAKFGATISSYVLSVEGKSYAASGGIAISDALTTSGNVTITGTVTDTRGFTAKVSQSFVVLNNLPTVNSFDCSTEYLDGVITYGFTPPVSLYYSKVRIDSIADGIASEVRTETIGTSVGAVSKTLSLTESQLESIYIRYPATANTTLRLTLLTYKDANYTDKMSEEPTMELDLKIPENDKTKPKIDSIICTPVEVLLGVSGLFVQGKNAIKTVVNATGSYGAGIVSRSWMLGNKTYEDGATSEIINTTGNVSISASVTDQRGFTATASRSVYYEPYVSPSVVPVSQQVAVQVEREEGDDTDYLKIIAARRFSALAGKNKCELRCRLKVGVNGAYGNWITLIGTDEPSNEYDEVSDIAISRDAIYYVEISVLDALGESGSIIIPVPTAETFMDRNGEDNSIAFGGYTTEKNAFEVYQTAYFRGGMYFDDIPNGKRYKITMNTSGQLIAAEVKNTYSLRRSR